VLRQWKCRRLLLSQLQSPFTVRNCLPIVVLAKRHRGQQEVRLHEFGWSSSAFVPSSPAFGSFRRAGRIAPARRPRLHGLDQMRLPCSKSFAPPGISLLLRSSPIMYNTSGWLAPLSTRSHYFLSRIHIAGLQGSHRFVQVLLYLRFQ